MEKEGRRELFRRFEEPEGEWITLFFEENEEFVSFRTFSS